LPRSQLTWPARNYFHRRHVRNVNGHVQQRPCPPGTKPTQQQSARISLFLRACSLPSRSARQAGAPAVAAFSLSSKQAAAAWCVSKCGGSPASDKSSRRYGRVSERSAGRLSSSVAKRCYMRIENGKRQPGGEVAACATWQIRQVCFGQRCRTNAEMSASARKCLPLARQRRGAARRMAEDSTSQQAPPSPDASAAFAHAFASRHQPPVRPPGAVRTPRYPKIVPRPHASRNVQPIRVQPMTTPKTQMPSRRAPRRYSNVNRR